MTTTTSTAIIRRRNVDLSAAERVASVVGNALVSWANARVDRTTMTHERWATVRERERVISELESRSIRMQGLRQL